MTPHENRLAREKSPYLLQHAHNPVDWYPWGTEAFEKAKREDRPIFLSIGYSTCHWCHVMERESFENGEIAKILNENFVSIKVDREERPDVDQIYMSAVQAMTGGGGWPLSAFLTHDLEPFFTGTYFPPEGRWGRPGFKELLLEISRLWKTDRAKLISSAGEIGAALKSMGRTKEGKGLSVETLRRAYRDFADLFDPREGGFGGAPKFPRSETISLLFRIYRRTGEKKALQMGIHTLDKMARGGIYDQVGGGFHRYSIDNQWLVPHFEKMLYDNALLVRTYLEAFQIVSSQGEIAALPPNPPSVKSGLDRSLRSAKRSESDLADARSLFAGVARETLDYILRDMTSPEGGFYSAQDADSEGVEGKYYVWSEEELQKLLTPDEFKQIKEVFQTAAHGNFEDSNILHMADLPWARRNEGALASAKEKLLEIRYKRIPPLKDDKVIASWNGLMIGTMAFAARVLQERRYLDAARKGADFILRALWDGQRLKRRYREGESRHDGSLDDYSFMIRALLDLYETDFDIRWLEAARDLQARSDELFWDEKDGGYFFTDTSDSTLIVRSKEITDGAVPSGNSVAALNLLRLYRFTLDGVYEKKATEIFRVFSDLVSRSPQVAPALLAALDFATDDAKEIVVAGARADPEVQHILKELHHRFLPNAVLALADHSDRGKVIPLLQGIAPQEARATIYLCEGHVCRRPVHSLEEIREGLEKRIEYPL